MRVPLASLLLGVLFAGGVVAPAPAKDPSPAQDPASATESMPEDVDATLSAALDAALTSAEGLAGVRATASLYDAAVFAHGDPSPVFDELRAIAEDSESDGDRALAARWVLASLLRQHGDLSEALGIISELDGEDGSNPAVALAHAQLLDAEGRTEPALEAYERALELTADEAGQAAIRLRMAMMALTKGADDEGALADFALEPGRDPDIRNRAAVVLAILGRPEEAIELFVVRGEGTARFRQDMRVAEWAIAAQDDAAAQEYAWRAMESATLRRDRHYALAVLVEAYRDAEAIDALIERFRSAPDLDPAAHQVWIDLLRETGRIDEAMELFEGSQSGGFTVAMRRELLEMYREAGREDLMLEVYQRLIEEEPTVLEWREGLSRYLLERGRSEEAADVWASFADEVATDSALLHGADTLMNLGLDELAIDCAEESIRRGLDPSPALLFLFGLHKERGELAEAGQVLERLDGAAPPEAAARLALAEAFEQLGNLDRAVAVLEAVRDARGQGEAGEDLEMRLSWLYSEVGEEEAAMQSWLALWRRIDSIPRRRYVEDRLMTVASRLGKLADVAIELEEKLMAGTANERESGLLVRLYTKVGDPVSATEVIEEFMKRTGGNRVDLLQEKARVYVSCTDYHNYEKTVRELMAVDPEGRPDYLRQMAMSQLERGKPDEARQTLSELADIERGVDGAEFEAGVLALSGMRLEAIEAYRLGLAAHPERIDGSLLMANLMKEIGQVDRAIGMFQHMAETAEEDDIFMIAIDGLLNMEAPASVVKWARRITLERLAWRHDKMYLYQLLSDLSEELNERGDMITALEGSLAIAGERRYAILREVMDLARTGGSSVREGAGGKDKLLAMGRRLIGLEEVVPPQVYLDLGDAFLASDDAASAAKTFRLARDLPDADAFQQKAAGQFEDAGYLEQALAGFERVLVTHPSDVALLAKVAELNEQLGRDDLALDLYRRAAGLLLDRRPVASVNAKAKVDVNDPFRWYSARNVDDYDQYSERVYKGLLVTLPASAVTGLLDEQRAELALDLAQVRELEAAAIAEAAEQNDDHTQDLDLYPRLLRRTELFRRVALAYELTGEADELDVELLALLPEDQDLLEELVNERLAYGFVGSARALILASGRSEPEQRKALFLVGEGEDAGGGRSVPLAETTRLFLQLLASGREQEATTLLLRIDYSGVDQAALGTLQAVFSAALYLDDPDLILSIGRQWLRLHVKYGSGEYELEPVLERCMSVLEGDDRRSLCEYFVSLVLEDAEQASKYVRMLPRIQSRFDEPIVEQEQILELLDGYGESYAWGLAPVLQLLPEDQRGGSLRTIWPKVQNTGRSSFLIEIVAGFSEPLGPGLSEFIEGAFDETLEHSDTMLQYRTFQLFESVENPEVALALADAIRSRQPTDWIAGGIQAVMLKELGREKEALDRALEVFPDLMDGGGDYYTSQGRQKIFDAFLPGHLPDFLARLEQIAEDDGRSAELALKRVDVIQTKDDPVATLAVLEEAAADYPDDVSVLERLLSSHRRSGRQFEAITVMERLLELEPESSHRRRDLVEALRAVHNPVKALAVSQAGPMDGADALDPDFPAGMMIMSSGGAIISGADASSGSSTSDEDWPEGKIRPATIQRVKDALEEGATDEAGVTLRRIWRTYPKAQQSNIIYYFGGSYRNPTIYMKWPGDEDAEAEETEEQKRSKRGGMDAYREADAEPPEELPAAWSVLADYDVGAREIESYLRTTDPGQLDTMQPVCEGLLRARTARDGEDETFAGLLARVRDGHAGKIDYVLFLAMLDREPERVTPDVQAVLSDLIRTLNPLDVGQLRRLGRAYARADARAEATRLYRWVATQTQSSSRFWGQSGTVDARGLVKEVKETLAGEDQRAVIEAILAFADPGDDPWSRESYELLVLETWEELAGADATLEKYQAICAAATDFSTGLRRRTAKRAAYLYAHQGDVDQAIACFETGLAKLDKSLFTVDDPYVYIRPEYSGYISHEDLRLLFPAGISEWPEAAEWLRRASSALESWVAEDRFETDRATPALALAAVRLFGLGDEVEARAIVERLAASDEQTPLNQLWIADAARRVGLVELSDSIERALLDENRLLIHRIPDVVARVLDHEGGAEALAVGEPVAELTQGSELIDVLVRAAEAVSDEKRATHWRTVGAACEAAEEELELEQP